MLETARRVRCYFVLFSALLAFAAATPAQETFQFVILGDRTGETVDHVFEQVLTEAGKTNPVFILTVGDTIQGLNDGTADAEWREAQSLFMPYKRFPLYLAPGNHDIWNQTSEQLFEKYSGHPRHYGFDFGTAHFTVLDNSRSEELSTEEMAFLEQDLKAHASKPLKFIVHHRPSWILSAAALNPNFPLHQIARKYGVQYVIAGHLHELLHFKLEGVDYISMPSAGGHLRGSLKYQDGWFYGFAVVEVSRNTADIRIHELQGSISSINEWGPVGLVPSR